MTTEHPDHRLRALRSMKLVRAFEEHVMAHPNHGVHLSAVGEEAVAAGLCQHLAEGDQLLSSSRSAAAILSRCLEIDKIMAEFLGKQTGPCHGRARRGHFAWPAAGFFGAYPVVAGNLSVGLGVAFAMQYRRTRGVVAIMFGDGACGAGALHECLNIAALWKLPVIFVCTNNGYAISTPTKQALAASALADLARPHGIPAVTVDGMDYDAVFAAAGEAVARARCGSGPAFLECVAYRFHPHSTLSRELRPPAEIESWLQRCPIRTLEARLKNEGLLSTAQLAELSLEANAAVARAVQLADSAPDPQPQDAFADVW